jgi:hypothetical protein
VLVTQNINIAESNFALVVVGEDLKSLEELFTVN